MQAAGLLWRTGQPIRVAISSHFAPILLVGAGLLMRSFVRMQKIYVRRDQIAPADGIGGGEEIVWTSGSAADALTRVAARDATWIERDLGSGGSPARITPVPNADVQARVEASLRARVPVLVAREVSSGHAPAVCSRAPLPRIDLSRARFFRVTAMP